MLFSLTLNAQETITFPSEDGLLITADIYEVNNGLAPVMVLCHQARFSRGEYQKTVVKLQKMGFTCMAIDQRSGDKVSGVINETAKRAKEKGLPQRYIDAEPDIVAAVNEAYNRWGRKVILVGSSYSASLVLKIAAESDKVEAVISFSPGEYFEPEDLIVSIAIEKLDKYSFVTSSKKEVNATKGILHKTTSDKITHFIPKNDGIHGSRALWRSTPNNEEYWDALRRFLGRFR